MRTSEAVVSTVKQHRMLGYSLVLMSCVGSVYGFSAYAQQLKQAMGYTQEQVELVGELLHVGLYLGPAIGLAVDLLLPYQCFLLAAALSGAGYSAAAAIIANRAPKNPVLLALCFMASGFGSGLGYTTALYCNVKNMAQSNYKGILTAVLVCMFGFSAMIFSGFYNAIFHHNSVPHFLYFCGGVLSLVLLLAIPMIKFQKDRTSDDFLDSEPPSLKRSFRTLKFLFSQFTFWTLWVPFIFIAGAGLMHINNVGNAIKSLNNGVEDARATFVCLTLLSAGNGIGRLAMGASDFVPYYRGIFYSLSLLFMSFFYLVNAIAATDVSVLYYTTFGIGLSYGMAWSIMPTIASESFGTDRFPQVWGWFMFAPSLSSLLFNNVAGVLYQHAIKHYDPTSHSKNCAGVLCYRYAFIFACGTTFFGFLVSLLAVKYTEIPGKKVNYVEVRAQSPDKADTEAHTVAVL